MEYANLKQQEENIGSAGHSCSKGVLNLDSIFPRTPASNWQVGLQETKTLHCFRNNNQVIRKSPEWKRIFVNSVHLTEFNIQNIWRAQKKETTLRFYLTLVRMTKINKTVDKKYQRAGVEKGRLVLYRWIANLYKHYENQCREFSRS